MPRAYRPRIVKLQLDDKEFRRQFAQTVSDASRTARELGSNTFNRAFIESASESRKQIEKATAAARKFGAVTAASTATAARGMGSFRERSLKTLKTVGEIGEAIYYIHEGGKTLVSVAKNFSAIGDAAKKATASLKRFFSAGKGKGLLLGGAGIIGAVAGYKLLQATLGGVGADASVAGKALESMRATVGSVASSIGIGFKVAGGVLVATAGAFVLLGKSAVDAAGRYEQFQTGFEVLLGSADKARDRLRELATFANTTPFELDEVAAASRTLETLTKGALSAGNGLRLVGDVASGVQRPFEEVANTVGRLFDALRSGRTAGESLNRLQELGAISGNVRNRIESLSAIGLGADAWQLAQKELSRFSGMMDKQSRTWVGLMSSFQDSISEALRQFGAPLIEGLKPTLKTLTEVVSGLAPKAAEFGKAFGAAVKTGSDVILGVFAKPSLLTAPLGYALSAAFKTAGNALLAAIKTAFGVISQPSFFTNLALAFKGLSEIIGGYFAKAFAKPAALISATVAEAMAEIPTELGGSGEREAAAAQVKPLEDARQNMMFKALRAQTPDARAMYQQKAAELATQAGEQRKIATGNVSISERADKMVGSGELAGNANLAIDDGTRTLRAATGALFQNIADGLKNFKVDDVLGAGGDLRNMRVGIARAAKIGQQTRKQIAESAAASPPKASFSPEFIAASIRPTSFSGSGKLSTGGLQTSGGLNDPAVHNSPLLSKRERDAARDQSAAELAAKGIKNARAARSPGGYNTVRRGDKQRAREVMRERIREKVGIERTNQLLEINNEKFDMVLNSLVKD